VIFGDSNKFSPDSDSEKKLWSILNEVIRRTKGVPNLWAILQVVTIIDSCHCIPLHT